MPGEKIKIVGAPLNKDPSLEQSPHFGKEKLATRTIVTGYYSRKNGILTKPGLMIIYTKNTLLIIYG